MDEWTRWAAATVSGRTAAVDVGSGSVAIGDGAEVELFRRGEAKPSCRWRLRKGARRLRFYGGERLAATDRGGGAALLRVGEEARTAAEPPGLLLDALVDPRRGRLVTCDRDEKIRSCRYPGLGDVESYCLGHEEFVSCLELLPHAPDALASGSGDGSVALWHLPSGRRTATPDAGDDDDETPVELDGRPRPVAKLAVAPLSADRSLLVVSRYGSDRLVAFETSGPAANPAWRRLPSARLPAVPLDLAADGETVYACFEVDGEVRLQGWRFSSDGPPALSRDETSAAPAEGNARDRRDPLDELAPLFKKRVDGVAEYAERKRRRIETDDRRMKQL